MNLLGMKTNPCTTDNSCEDDHKFAYCECAKCGKVDQNLPWDSFTATPEGLLCASCNPDTSPQAS